MFWDFTTVTCSKTFLWCLENHSDGLYDLEREFVWVKVHGDPGLHEISEIFVMYEKEGKRLVKAGYTFPFLCWSFGVYLKLFDP